jgi:hypothetical protein
MKKPFQTEAELCAAFIEYHAKQGFIAYAETAGFDVLLVRDGWQWGVQAKLTLNTKVLCQLLPDSDEVGPDFRVILVPERRGLGQLCAALGFVLQAPYSWGRAHTFDNLDTSAPDWNPVRRCELPEFVPDVAAGASGPVQLTKWKVGALRVVAHLKRHGGITRKEIRRYGCDPTRWCAQGFGWLQPHEDRAGVYVIGPKMPRFDQQHPDVFAQILEAA